MNLDTKLTITEYLKFIHQQPQPGNSKWFFVFLGSAVGVNSLELNCSFYVLLKVENDTLSDWERYEVVLYLWTTVTVSPQPKVLTCG